MTRDCCTKFSNCVQQPHFLAQVALLFLFPLEVEINNGNDGADDENEARLVSVCHEIRPVLAEHHARVENRRRPRERSRDRVGEEPLRIDARKTRRQRDERADHGQHTAEEDRLQSVAVEPVLRRIDVGFFDEEILPVAIHERTPAARADLIGEERAQETADYAREQRALERHMPRIDEIARESEDKLARYRNAGVFRRHEHGDSDIAP